MTEDVVRAMGLLCLGTRLKRLGERLQAGTDEMIAEHDLGVTASQHPYLISLDRLGPLTLGEVADAVGVSQPGATRTVNELIRKDFIAAEVAPDDQRRKMLSLTDKGRRLVEQGRRDIWPDVEDAVRDLCAGLDGDFLAHLAAIETALDERPLARRAGQVQDT